MKVYNNERKDKIDSLVSSNTSLAYTVKLEPELNSKVNIDKLLSAIASKNSVENYGLHPMKSLLVSSVWNLNDDVFLAQETIAAKDTPRNKPMNIGHNQKEIVGHMTDSYVIDSEGKDVAVDVKEEDIPEKVHIIANSLIYTHWYDKEQKEKIDKLLEDIKAGKYYVSMEAVFADFDYALQDAKGQVTIVERNEDTSWMTKHLAAYKGTGSVLEYKIGRVPRQISFNGIGIVEEPANPESIIFAKKEEINDIKKDLGYILSSELKNKGNLMDETAKAEYEKKVSELTLSLSAKEKTVKELEDAKASLEATKVSLEAKVTELSEAKASVEKELVESKSKLETIEKEKIFSTRLSYVVSKLGLDEKEAKEFVENLETVNEEKFTKVVDSQAAKFVKKVEESTASKIETVLENVEKSKEVNISVASTVETVDADQKAVLDISKFLSNKKK